MSEKFPAADLSRYFAFLAQAAGKEHKHHIAPRAVFQDLSSVKENIILLSSQEHFYAHYLLALAVPECQSFQVTFYLMANVCASQIRADELPHYAEVYERGAQATAEHMKKLNADPVFAAAHAERMKKLHTDPEFSAANAERNSKQLKKLHANYEYATARDECSSAVMKKLHADCKFAAAHAARSREHMKKLHKDAVFAAACAERCKTFAHIRWHVKRRIISNKCKFCLASLVENNQKCQMNSVESSFSN